MTAAPPGRKRPPLKRIRPGSAVGRSLALMSSRERDAAKLANGYLDVLGRDVEARGFVQGLMHADSLSLVYERWWRPALGRMVKGLRGPDMAEEHRIARLLLALERGDGVLDVACGPGNFSREFARVVDDTGLVVGIDGSLPMLERAVREARREGTQNLALMRADAASLPFVDAAFDATCCFAALNLFADPFAALDEMRRVLAPGGRIALFTSCGSSSQPLRALESALAQRSGVRIFGRFEIVDALRERGFAQLQHRISGFTQFVGGRLPA